MTSPNIPIIDISPFLNRSSDIVSRLATAKALDSACRDVGFFYLSNHSIPSTLTTSILSLAESFFSLPSTEKQKIRLQSPGDEDGDGARGYQCIGENVTQGKRDWHEGLDFYRPVEGAPEHGPYGLIQGPNKWPMTPSEFKLVYEEYIDRLLELGNAVMRAIAMGLGEQEDYFLKYVDHSFWVLRAIGYPPLDDYGADLGISCGEHTDYGCLTFLLASPNVKGSLQVLLPSSNEWISADPIDGCFVCNIGDMMQVWTNNQYTSTLHRVIHKSLTYRVSVPFFFEPNFDALIEPMGSCVAKDGGVRQVQEKLVYGEHLLKKVTGNFYAGDEKK